MELRFVDRGGELTALHMLAERGVGVPLYLYGPEGCGKTRLLREFARRVRGRGGYLVIYIDALEERDPRRAVEGSAEVRKLLLEAAAGAAGGPVGVALAYAVARVLAIVERRLVEGKHVVVVVDDVFHPLGLEGVEAYMKSLLNLAEYDLPEKNPSSILIMVSTSEGLSLERVRRHPTWATVRLLWNLPREGFEELAALLNPPSSGLVEEAWRLTGGNPRALIQLATAYQWRVEAWLRDLKMGIVAPLLAEARARGLVDAVREIAEDPDAPVAKAAAGLLEAARLLVEHNLLTYKASSTLTGDPLPPNRELGVGEYYAWQLPAYRELMRGLLQAKD